MKDQFIILKEETIISKPAKAETKTLARIPELDGLRGIAILLVLSFHYINNQLVGTSSTVGRMLEKATAFGWVGVDLFFVLSGFLIGSILIRNKPSKNYFSTFYVRRLVRIVPNYFLAVAIFILICSLPYFAGNEFLTGNNVIPWWSYFAMVHNIYMAALQSMGNDALSITWSIGIEEQFYLVFPFIVFFLKDKWLPYLLVGCIVAACVLRYFTTGWIPAYVLLPCRMDGLALGILIAWFSQRIDLTAFVTKNRMWFLLAMVVDVLLCGALYYKYGDLGSIRHTLFALFFGICIVLALTQKRTWYAAVLRNKYLTWVGAISYSLYLFHYMMLGIVHHVAGNTKHIGIHGLKDVLITLVALVLSLLFSWVVYTVLETRFVKLGKRFRY